MTLAFTVYGKESIPEEVRRAVLRRANGLCEDCGDKQRLEVHHLTYRSIGRESADELMALCRRCHQSKHIGPDGNFYRDPEECAMEWDHFDHLISKG